MTNNEQKLKVLLEDYRISREQIGKKTDYEIQFYIIIITALGIIYGITFQSQYLHLDLVYLIPVLMVPLALKIAHTNNVSDRLRNHIILLEEQIKEIIGKKWMSFGYRFDVLQYEGFHKIKWKYDIASKAILIGLIPTFISGVRSIDILYNSIKDITSILSIESLSNTPSYGNTGLPIVIHIIFFGASWFFFFLFIYRFVIWSEYPFIRYSLKRYYDKLFCKKKEPIIDIVPNSIEIKIKENSTTKFKFLELSGKAINTSDELLRVFIIGHFYVVDIKGKRKEKYVGCDRSLLGEKNYGYVVPSKEEWRFKLIFIGDTFDKINSWRWEIYTSRVENKSFKKMEKLFLQQVFQLYQILIYSLRLNIEDLHTIFYLL